ncbi:hypothetical protein PybrP1_010698, partial [[Pythium] brassicae (nom. inval.)]
MPHFQGAEDAQDASSPEAALAHSQSRLAQDEGEKDATSFQLKQTYAVGFRASGRNMVDFLTESVVVYPAAHHVVLFNTETSSMEFLHHTRSVRSVQCFHLSPNRELLAVAETHHSNASSLHQGATAGVSLAAPSPAKPTASSLAVSVHLHEQHEQHVLCIYRTASRSRVRAITLPHHSSIVSCGFSACNKFLALLEDAPTHNVTYWKVSNAKLLASCKCPSRGARIHINPSNASYISVSGPTVLKYWLWTNSEFKIGNFLPQLREQDHFVDHVWTKEYMIALSEKGLLLCFRASADFASVDLVHSYRCHHLSFVRMECITAHAKGFVLGGSAGFFSIYETSDDPKDPFSLVRSVSVGDVAFESVAVSPSVETVVVCTKSQELLTFAMSSIDTVQEDRVDYREFARHGYQVGAVVQIDICVQRPIVASCGADKSVRVWNYELKQYELLHQCSDEPLALGLHPCGFQVAVAFKERVRVFNILVESLRQVRELPVKSCRAIRYARGGHLLACAAGLTVLVFRSYTFDLVHTFAGHIGAVRCLAWSKDDAFLYSAAHDGAVYRWSIATGGRSDEMQHVVKQCQYTALVVDEKDPRVVVAAGSDGKVRELVAGEEATVVDLAPGVCVTAMALAKDNKRLFAGTNIGSVLAYPWPLSSKGVVESFEHAEAVSHMSVTEDNESLVTSSDDGSICVFRISSSLAVASGGGSGAESGSGASDATLVLADCNASAELLKQQEKKRVAVAFMDTVLIARDDLEERHAALAELRQRFEQVKADVEFALHRKENEWIDRLRVVKDECEALVVQERVRYEELEARHQQAGRKHAEELTQKEVGHATLTQELENQYERKLAQEVARYDALSETLEQTRQQCAALLESQDSQHRGALHGERKASYARTKEQNEVIRRLHDDLKYNHVKFEEVLHQEETEYEQELGTVRAEYERQLALERQNTAIKQGQVSASNTKLESLKKKIQELKASSHARDVLFATERAKTAKLEATLSHYEKHFETCTVSLADKDKAIQGLKSSNRVLENFRSVLHHRIDNLEVEKAPMQAHLHGLEAHIAEMQTELFDEFKAKAAAGKDGANKDAKIKMLLHEVKMLRQSTLKKEYAVSEMTRELTRLAQITNLKDMEAAVKDAYKAFVVGELVHKKPPRAVALLVTPSRADEGGRGDSSHDSRSVSKLHTVAQAPSEWGSPATRGGAASSLSRATTAPSPVKGAISKHETPQHGLQQRRGGLASSSTTAPARDSNSNAADEALGYDCKQAVDESVKQMEYMSRTVQTLRNALESTKIKADRVRRDAVAEGSVLIDECNKLRKENKRLHSKIRELEHAIGSSTGGLRSPPLPGNSNGSTGGGAGTPMKELQTSLSCPELLEPLQLSPECGSAHEPNSAGVKLLLPLSTTPLRKPGKQPGPSPLPRSPLPRGTTSALSSRHGGAGNNVLPFARLQLEREKRSGHATKIDGMAQLVERQRKEIQRLQNQVQLLLAEEDSS